MLQAHLAYGGSLQRKMTCKSVVLVLTVDLRDIERLVLIFWSTQAGQDRVVPELVGFALRAINDNSAGESK